MTNFKDNFCYLYNQSDCKTDDQFGQKIGLSRWTVNKLRNGTREPTAHQQYTIAQYCGFDSDDLYLDHKLFKQIYLSSKISSNFMIHALNVVSSNLHRCRELFPKYSGQYIVYTNVDRDGMVAASLLDIKRVTKNGIEFTMINPYRESGKKYEAFEYRGYMVPVDDFLYFVAEQIDASYEILTMMFYSSGAPRTGLLRGLWSGIGVREGKKRIASVAATAVRREKNIEDWRAVIDKELGYVKAASLLEMVKRNLSEEIIQIED